MEMSEEMIAYLRAGKEAGCPPDQMENFLRAGIALQPRQLSASAAARACDREGGPTEIGFGGARGGGKSYWSFSQVSADDCQRVPGLKVLFLRKVGKANTEQLDDLRKRVLRGIPHTFIAHRGILNFPNGSRIIAGHFQHENDIDAYLGLEYDAINIEEATTLAERKYKDIKTCLRSSKSNWRPRMYLTTNPGGVGHAWFKRRFITPYRNGAESDTRFVRSLATDNAFINADYHATLNKLTGWHRSAWKDGNWDLPMGQYFPTFNESVHVRDEIDDSLIREWAAAMDYGFTHNNCVYLGGYDGDGNFYVVDFHRERQWLPQKHAPAIKAMIARHNRTVPVRGGLSERKLQVDDLTRFVVGADAFSKQSDGTTIAQAYQKLGVRMTCANTDRIQGWAELQRLMGDPHSGIPPKIFVHRKCAALIDSLQSLQHDPNRPEDVLKVDCDDEGNGGDDDADALRYLVATRNRRVTMAKLRGT
jgi:phage terminase large subunit